MLKRDFYYDLPEELIAQHPIEPRDHSRLLILPRRDGEIRHARFDDLPGELRPGDCLIINDTRVIPARLYGVREDTGVVVEFLLLRQQGENLWETLCGPGKKARPGHRFSFGEGLIRCEVMEILPGGNRLVRFDFEGVFYSLLEQVGQMPLPPYITERLFNPESYQTVYSTHPGSAAAPTAGLHFTKELLENIRQKGVNIGKVTLHVGLGTFRPVKVEHIEEHHMHSEFYSIPAETADLVNKTKERGGRVICVGTTSCRTVESAAAASPDGRIHPHSGDTDIFITPGFQFRCMDGLITNFHLPESTLLMLVSAFAGHARVMEAYKTAVEQRYRFFSFGDAMFII